MNGPCTKFDKQNFDEFIVVFIGKYYKEKVRSNFDDYWLFIKFAKISPIKLLHYTVPFPFPHLVILCTLIGCLKAATPIAGRSSLLQKSHIC